MKNISHNKSWCTGVVKTNFDPYTTPLIKIKLDLKTERDYVKIKLHRNHMSEKSYMHEFKMALFEKGNPEELILFVPNLRKTLEGSVTIESDVNLLTL